MTRWTGTVVAVAISDVYLRPSSAWKKRLNLQVPFSSDFKAKISDAYRIFAELVQDKNSTRKVFKKPAKVSPVEFTTIGFHSYRHFDHGSAV